MRTNLVRLGLVGVMLWACGAALGDTITLKDGTVLEGRVIPQGDGYWIKLADGNTRTIPASEVKSVRSGAGPAPTTAGVVTPVAPAGTGDFQTLKKKADAVEQPMAAVILWQKFIDTNPTSPDLKAANEEMERWKKLADDGAEKIGGKWIGGDERKAILDKVEKLGDEAMELMQQSKTIQAMKKLEEAAKVYPNSFPLTFMLGWVNMNAQKDDDAIRYFEQCLKLRPESVETMNNLALLLYEKGQTERATAMFLKAAETRDTSGVAKNLMKLVGMMPDSQRRSAKMKPVVDAALLLAGKYGLDPDSDWKRAHWLMAAPKRDRIERDPNLVPGLLGSGTGFIIREDGLILTNRHVVEHTDHYLVTLQTGERKTAELVAVDTEQDLALLRVNLGKKLPTAALSKTDSPSEGAQCYVMGYPLIDRMGATMKITQGIVSGKGRAGTGVDIVVDAKVNPGNSGGPLVDKFGQVMGIVTMKSMSTAMEDSYGMAISSGRIRVFLAKQKITLVAAEPGPPLSAEEVAAKVKPATVCILVTK